MANGSWSAEFINCSPPEEVRNNVDRIMEQIDADTPSDSSIQITLEQADGSVYVRCEVHSAAGTFLSSASGPTAEAAAARLQRDMKRQMDAWKKNRFSDEESVAKAG